MLVATRESGWEGPGRARWTQDGDAKAQGGAKRMQKELGRARRDLRENPRGSEGSRRISGRPERS
eukprot:12403531-Karenia_brevis.AAC.1